MLSDVQIEVMKNIMMHKKFIRYNGGFWAEENFKFEESAPKWWCGIDTLRSLHKKGYVKLDEENKECVIINEIEIPNENVDFLKKYPELNSEQTWNTINSLVGKQLVLRQHKIMTLYKTQNKKKYDTYGINVGDTLYVPQGLQSHPYCLFINHGKECTWASSIHFNYIEIVNNKVILIDNTDWESFTEYRKRKYIEFEILDS